MASSDALLGLTKWLSREQWRGAFDDMLDQHLAVPCARVGIATSELADVIGDHHTTVLFACILEDFLTRSLDDGRNIVDDYLKRRGWKESSTNRAYIAALRSSVMSLHEISDIRLDESFLARDLVRGGEPIRVSERLGTRYLKPWDRVAGRLVPLGSRTEMAGGLLPFQYETSESALKAFRHAGKSARAEVGKLARERGNVTEALPANALTDTELLRSSAFLFTNVWLADLLHRVLNPKLPQMCNADGDELMFTRVSFPLNHGASADAIRLSLAAMADVRAESGTFWNWIGKEQRASRKRPEGAQTFFTTLDDGSLVLGTIELKDKMLVLEANSQQRAERGRIIVETGLGDLVGEPQVQMKTVAQLMASRPDKRSERSASGLAPDAERALLQAHLDQHYVNLLDEPVPMLSNMTPRGAAKSAKGVQKLVAWLKLLENSAARAESSSPMAGYDFTWMWQELGIAALRR